MPVLLSLKSRFLWKLFIAFFSVAFFALAISYLYLVPQGASIWVALGVAIFFSSVMGFVVARSFSRSIAEILEMLGDITHGNFTLRFRKRSFDEFDGIAHQITTMSRSIKTQFDVLAAERLRLETILDSMIEGVLVTDKRGHVLLMNRALINMLDVAPNYQGKRFIECCRNTDLQDIIRTVLDQSDAIERSIVLHRISNISNFMVHASPLEQDDQNNGCVAVLHDVTRLRKLEDHRKEFVANVSHELKTPLTSIRGYAETLKEGAISDPVAAVRFVDKILKNASQLQNLVDDILEISTIESGYVDLNKVDVVLLPLIQGITRDCQEGLASKKMTIKIEVDSSLSVISDVKALGQILRNLIDNAIKYTPEEGQITVSAKVLPVVTEISVQDTGIGIDQKDQSRIFERFFRVDQSRSREAGGTGLGLAIVKHLVQASGWSIRVKSKLHEGTCFTVVIPNPPKEIL